MDVYVHRKMYIRRSANTNVQAVLHMQVKAKIVNKVWSSTRPYKNQINQ